MIILARALTECGVECKPRQIWEAAGVSPSTYWRADASLRQSLQQIHSARPELQGLSLSRQVAEAIRKDFAPQLTRLFAGEVEVNTYHRLEGRRERPTRRVERKATKSVKGVASRRAPDTVSTKSNKSSGKISTAAKTASRKKPAKQESNLSLLDLLPS